jgi:uncharacterized membrane protein YeaQ/YmgE (transglycosylase-associated protein family)
MGILLLILLGLIAGIIAKWIMPGRGPQSMILTILLGIAGAVVGGFLGQAIGLGDAGFSPVGLVVAIGGSVLLLIAYGFIQKRG